MGASPEEKRPILPVHSGGGGASRSQGGDTSLRDARAAQVRWCGGILAVILAAAAFVWYLCQINMSLEYSVAITGVSGLDPVTDLQQGKVPLNPVFNLTIGIASPSATNGGCILPRTSIKVSYSHLSVPMAGGRAPEMCVGPRQSVEPRQVVAGGHDVALPGFLVDSLAEDMRRGDAMFEVKLTVLEDENQWKMVTCWARLGDATGAALKIPCKETWRSIDSIPEQDPGYVPLPRSVPAAGLHLNVGF